MRERVPRALHAINEIEVAIALPVVEPQAAHAGST